MDETLAMLALNAGGGAVIPGFVDGHWVRGVVPTNVASLAAFTVAGNDGLTYSAGQRVLLIAQTTPSQNGIYTVGTVGGGTAPLTRPTDWNTGAVIEPGTFVRAVEGTAFGRSQWSLDNASPVTVDTTSATFSSGSAGDGVNGARSRGYMTDQATTNGQGSGGPTTVGVVYAVSRYSGIFRWGVSATQEAAAAGETVTWNVGQQFSGAVPGGPVGVTGGVAAAGSQAFYANGVAGTGISAISNLGTSNGLATETDKVATLGIGSRIAATGMMGAGVAGTTETPFARGANVALTLAVTNDMTNRVVSSMNMWLEEVVDIG